MVLGVNGLRAHAGESDRCFPYIVDLGFRVLRVVLVQRLRALRILEVLLIHPHHGVEQRLRHLVLVLSNRSEVTR